MFRLLTALTLFLLIPSFAAAQSLEAYDRVPYLNMAPGEDVGNETLKSFPAKIVFSSETGIPYGGVFARVYNSSGILIFKYLAEKPWLFMRLPTGDYHIIAVDRNKITRIKAFRIPKDGGRKTVVKLDWPKSAVGY